MQDKSQNYTNWQSHKQNNLDEEDPRKSCAFPTNYSSNAFGLQGPTSKAFGRRGKRWDSKGFGLRRGGSWDSKAFGLLGKRWEAKPERRKRNEDEERKTKHTKTEEEKAKEKYEKETRNP